MYLFEEYNIDIGYVLLGTIAFLIILFILIIVNISKQKKLKEAYKKFMNGKNGESLEEQFNSKFTDIEEMKKQVSNMSDKLDLLGETVLSTYQKIGIIKYDAYKEMGGELSFVLALLNKKDSGFLLNSIHSSREGCFTYIKEVTKGECNLTLSEEEAKALELAKNSKIEE